MKKTFCIPNFAFLWNDHEYTATKLVKILWCPIFTPPPSPWISILIYLWPSYGGCYSISDDLSGSFKIPNINRTNYVITKFYILFSVRYKRKGKISDAVVWQTTTGNASQTYTKTTQKRLITQRSRTDLGPSVGATTVSLQVWLKTQPSPGVPTIICMSKIDYWFFIVYWWDKWYTSFALLNIRNRRDLWGWTQCQFTVHWKKLSHCHVSEAI